MGFSLSVFRCFKVHRTESVSFVTGSPASLGNTQQQNNHEVTSANGMHEDSVVIVGKGQYSISESKKFKN